ncbi:unnamed protein product [Blepharisma stoltei]|uniref:Uncharacterized protein n=1 Tax=Blepharisma stoltei TaxID=1481888 RepID=A0AAU9IVC0_9CILI|nr:unnamed protein product [Blepharisma stoltei]
MHSVDVDSLDVLSLGEICNANWCLWDPTCLLNDGSLFCCCGASTYIITPANIVKPLDSSKYSHESGLVAVNDFVYMFGGQSNISAKFSLKSENWKALAQYPVANNLFISCAHFNGNIIIAGSDSNVVLGYNIVNDSFSNIPIELHKLKGKTCLATDSRCYIIEYGANYYESGVNNINSWKPIGSANMLNGSWPRHSYNLFRNESFYFITTNMKLIKFDLKTNQLKLLKIL